VTVSVDRRDFLDEIVDERRKRNSEFPDLVQAALERRAARPECGAPVPGRTPTRRLCEVGD